MIKGKEEHDLENSRLHKIQERRRKKESSVGYSDLLFFALILLSIGALLIEISLFEFGMSHQNRVATVESHDEDIMEESFTLFNPALEQMRNQKNRGKGEVNSLGNQTVYVHSGSVDIIKILDHAGAKITDDLKSQLPPNENVEKLYGPGIRIMGLDRCEEFRKTVPPSQAEIGGAGMFNTGTNLLAQLLSKNCYMPQRSRGTGMRWQVPWGKHPPYSWRYKNVAAAERNKQVNQTLTLAVATIKDPLSWMGSMCRHSYAANWKHKKDHCPNLIANEFDARLGLKLSDRIPVRVRYKPTNITHHESLAGLWNDYYGGYAFEAEYPRLIIRSEDMLFHTPEVIKQVCECGGGKMRDTFKYVLESAKGSTGAHHDAQGLVSAMVRYANETKRIQGFTKEDLDYVRQALDPKLMEFFHYVYPK